MSVQDRFLHYITFDTQSDPSSSSAPSTSKQLILAKELAQECEKLGLQASVDPYGIVYATLEASDETLPSLGFCAHMDTASELSGQDVKARIIKNYQGNTIRLNEEYSMSPKDYPALKDCIGDDLIVTDGTTLLGGDDKAGIAIIMQAVSYAESMNGTTDKGLSTSPEVIQIQQDALESIAYGTATPEEAADRMITLLEDYVSRV